MVINRRLLVFALLAILLIAGAVLGVLYGPRVKHGTGQATAEAAPQAVLPAAPPPVEAMAADNLLPVTAEEAVDINAARPFSTLPNVPAKPFHTALAGEERERAVSCLAIAALYEAGGDPDKQRPVMQVILNRVRHPAFPHSVCAVVFQGSERATGCQFTFTCDGALLRWRPSQAAIAAASKLASEMLDGSVDKRVGLATHYHTNWVVPYWSDNLDKVTAVDTHLFFRWKGYWGTGASFRSPPEAAEPRVQLLASFDDAHRPSDGDTALAYADLPIDSSANPALAQVPGAVPLVAAVPKPMVMALLPGTQPGRWSLDAVEKCGQRAECRVIGWSDAARQPTSLNADALAASPPDFVYVQVLRNREQKAYWDCSKWATAGSAKCLGSAGDTASLAMGSRP